jgi:hypothetical protein
MNTVEENRKGQTAKVNLTYTITKKFVDDKDLILTAKTLENVINSCLNQFKLVLYASAVCNIIY